MLTTPHKDVSSGKKLKEKPEVDSPTEGRRSKTKTDQDIFNKNLLQE